MKVAVTAQGTELSSPVDPRFGRARYIIIVDSETMAFEVVDNADNANSFKGAGIQAASMVHDRGAEVVMTGYCGPKAFKTLQAGNIKVVSDVGGTVREAGEMLKRGGVDFLATANAEAHWESGTR